MTHKTADLNAWPDLWSVDASQIGLPTGGAVIDSVEVRSKGCRHWRVEGRILPVDPEAEPIRFRVLMPQAGWNGRVLQLGGGGFDGSIPFMGGAGVGADMWYGRPDPIIQGYVVCGSDSGHVAPHADADNWSDPALADFSLNDEMLANFAHEAVKKLHDVVLAVVRVAYGRDPEHSYFAGTSNGGRQALMAITRYGTDFDGVICGYPAIHWIPMALAGLHVANAEDAAGEEGFIGPEDWARAFEEVIRALDGLDGLEDGIISNYHEARLRGSELRARLMHLLNPAQMRLLDACSQDIDVSFLGNEDFQEYPGFSVLQGEPLRDDYDLFVLNGLSSAPGARDSASDKFGEAVVSRQVMRDREFDVRGFDAEAHADELRRASDLLDASSLDWDDFVRNGGKAILYHGTYDQLIAVEGTIRYYEALCERYDRDYALSFSRMYVVPGAGHSIGLFDMGADLLGALDAWVCEGEGPQDLVARERRYDRDEREMLLCPQPYYARYVGGDPALASSFERTPPTPRR